jgi:hypothetical protein
MQRLAEDAAGILTNQTYFQVQIHFQFPLLNRKEREEGHYPFGPCAILASPQWFDGLTNQIETGP